MQESPRWPPSPGPAPLSDTCAELMRAVCGSRSAKALLGEQRVRDSSLHLHLGLAPSPKGRLPSWEVTDPVVVSEGAGKQFRIKREGILTP